LSVPVCFFCFYRRGEGGKEGEIRGSGGEREKWWENKIISKKKREGLFFVCMYTLTLMEIEMEI